VCLKFLIVQNRRKKSLFVFSKGLFVSSFVDVLLFFRIFLEECVVPFLCCIIKPDKNKIRTQEFELFVVGKISSSIILKKESES